ncbi:hypothetical protein D3C85_1155080 [compost metagenome]
MLAITDDFFTDQILACRGQPVAVNPDVAQAEHQVGTPEPFVEKRYRVIGDLLQKLVSQAHFAAAIRAQLSIQNQVRAHIHQRYKTHHGERCLTISRRISGAEMFSKLRRILCAQKCAIYSKHL